MPSEAAHFKFEGKIETKYARPSIGTTSHSGEGAVCGSHRPQRDDLASSAGKQIV